MIDNILKRKDVPVSETWDLTDLVTNEEAYNEGVKKVFEDEHQNDSIAKSILFEKGILSKDEERSLELLSIDISNFVRTELAKKGLKLHEIKLKFGRETQNGDLLLIDEISGQNIIAYQDTKYITPLLLDKIILNK